MKLKKKFTGGNMLDFEDVFFEETEDRKGTFNSSVKPIAAAIRGGWFSDVEPDADPLTVFRAADEDEILQVTAEIIETYQRMKIKVDEPDPN